MPSARSIETIAPSLVPGATATRSRPPRLRPLLVATLFFALGAVGGGTAGSAQEASPDPDDGNWYAERLTSGDTPLTVEYLWSRGPKLRSERVVRGHPIVTLVNGDRYVIYDRITREGISIARSPAAIQQDVGRVRPFANEFKNMMKAGAEKVGVERVASSRCDLYRVTDGVGRREVCVVGDDRLPIFTRVYVRQRASEVTSQYAEWSRKVRPPDSFYLPPADIQLEFVSYEEYLERAPKERLGPAPPTHRELLHGERN